MRTMHEQYTEVTRPAMAKQFSYANTMEMPRLMKVVVNVGAGHAKEQTALMNEVEKTLTTITGQKPVITKAKRAIASFKIRQGQPIGMMVTLRGEKMWSFLDRLINVALPRIRDFRGLPSSLVDRHGNFHLGIKDQTIFPEISYENIGAVHGLQVSLVTTSQNAEQATELLRQLGFPLAGAERLTNETAEKSEA